MSKVLSRENLVLAHKKVVANKGASGIDGISVNELWEFCHLNWARISNEISQGTYKPNPVKKVEIPKPDGGVRVLGIPCVVDLEKFFDKVNHDMLMARVARKVEDKLVLKLIRSYLQAGTMTDGIVVSRTEGTIQGAPLSPLLSNIMLDDLDKELERRGHRFCRFADDWSATKGAHKMVVGPPKPVSREQASNHS